MPKQKGWCVMNRYCWFLVALLFVEVMSASAMTNEQIAARADAYVGQSGWSCKEFINQVIGDLGGSVGSATTLGYRECYLQSGFTEVFDPQPGDVIQTSDPESPINHFWDNRDLDGNGKPDFLYHCAFVYSVVASDPECYVVIDSNYSYDLDKVVRKHNWNPFNYVTNKPGHRVYFYRLGTVASRKIGGYYLDGTIHQSILACYNQYASIIGVPTDNQGGGVYVHRWYNTDGSAYVEIQDFKNEADKAWYAIVCAPDVNEAHLLKGGFRWKYLSNPDAPKEYGAPLSGEYATFYYPIKSDGTFDCSAGKSKCLIRQDFEHDRLLIWDGTTVWEMANSCTGAKSADLICNGEPAQYVVIAGTPMPAGSFDLSAVADSSNSVYLAWTDLRYNARISAIYCNGAEVAKTSGRAFSHFPLATDTVYCYQVAAVTQSGLVLGYSNEVLVCTPAPEPNPLPNPEPPFPERVLLSLPQTVWPYGADTAQNGVYASGLVLDQYGNEMPAIRLIFCSSDPLVLAVSGDNGWCHANGIGTAQVWAQVYDWSGIQSEKLDVCVVTELPPQPVLPDIYESSPLNLESPIEILANQPYLECQPFTYAANVSNLTADPVTFWLRIFTFDLNGQKVDESSYGTAGKILLPGESWRWLGSGIFPPVGDYYLMAMTSLTGENFGAWQVVDLTADGLAAKRYFRSLCPSDLKPDLRKLGFNLSADEVLAGEMFGLSASVINGGDADAVDPFAVQISVRGLECQTCALNGLAAGGVQSCHLFFGPLAAGNYVADLHLDAANAVAEYDKANNAATLAFTVWPNPQPPVITVSPLSQKALTQSAVNFSVSAVRANPPDDPADEPFSYQWQKDGSDVTGATQSSFVISHVGFDQAGSYACVVTTAQGMSTVSQTAVLTVEQKLTVTKQPTVQTLEAGEPYFNAVEAVGAGGLKYQWYKNGQAIAGATAAVFQIAAVTAADAGWYYCRVLDSLTPAAQKAYSKTAELAVRPSDLGEPELRLAYIDGESRFTATLAAKGYALAGLLINPYALPAKKTYADITNVGLRFSLPATPYLCYDNGGEIVADVSGNTFPASVYDGIGTDASGQTPVTFAVTRLLNCKILPYLIISGKSYYLNLAVVKAKLNGMDLTVVSGKVKLYLATVSPQLTITAQPNSLAVKTGATVYFTVKAQGDPALAYQWRKNGSDLAGQIRFALKLANLQLSDAGEYSCLVISGSGAVLESNPAVLTVYQRLVITAQPKSQTAGVNSACSLQVAAIGQGALAYQWRKNGRNIAGATQSVYQIAKVVASDGASYYCVVSDSCPGTIQRLASQAAVITVVPELKAEICAECINSLQQPDCPENISVAVGGTVEMACAAEGGVPPYTYQWQLDGRLLAGATTTVLILSSITDADEGRYVCQVTDSQK